MIRSFACVVVLLPVLPAQNLIKWDQWKLVNSAYVKQFKSTATNLSFFPYCTGSSCPGYVPSTGIVQTVTIPKDDWYQLRVTGFGGGTGKLAFRVTIGASAWQDSNYQHLHIARTVFLRKGTTTVSFLSSTSNLWGADWWSLRQPTLKPVGQKPVLDVELLNGGQMSLRAFLYLESRDANLVAMSLLPLPLYYGIRIPGMSGSLYLDPNFMVILWASSKPGARLDLNNAVWRVQGILGHHPFYFQAASLKSFGPMLTL